MKKDMVNDIEKLEDAEYDSDYDEDIEEYDRYDEFADELDDEDIETLDDSDIEILKTRKKNEDYGEKSVGIVSNDLWGDWGRDNLKKKIKNDTDEISFIGTMEGGDIPIDPKIKESVEGIDKGQSSNYYSGVLNTELKNNNLYKKYRIIFINGYYYGYDLKNKKPLSLLTLIGKLPKESMENTYIKSLYKMNKI